MQLAELRAWFSNTGHVLTLAHAEAAVLMDHRLVWNYYSRNRRGGAANLAFLRGAEVWGAALWVCGRSLHGFDRKEGHPDRYLRRLRPVRLRSGRWVAAWTYFVCAPLRRGEITRPTAEYLALLRDGAECFALPAWYRSTLERIPVR